MLDTTIVVDGEPKLLDALAAALEPEKEDSTERASYTVELTKTNLKIHIQAKDITAFRAITGSITGLMAIVEKTWKVK